MILNELEKMRNFLKTRVPYISLLIGIFIAATLLDVEDGVRSRYWSHNAAPVYGEMSESDEEKFEFSICYISRGYNSFDVAEGLTRGFALITSAPAFAATHVLMAANVFRDPYFISERTSRTFAFLFIYFNAYFWMFGAFAIYSIHWELIRNRPPPPMTTLGL